MPEIALFEPEIPPNTGNIIRLCANTGYPLHLIHPLGFDIDDKRLRRAGLDYHEFTDIKQYENYDEFCGANTGRRILALSTKGSRYHTDIEYKADDILLFGPETRGLPDEVLAQFNQQTTLRLPMLENSRSMNLSNAVSVVVYESWRQLGFQGAK